MASNVAIGDPEASALEEAVARSVVGLECDDEIDRLRSSDLSLEQPMRDLPSGELTPTETRIAGLGAFELEGVPGGELVIVAASRGSTSWRADAGGADVLLSVENLLVLASPAGHGTSSRCATLRERRSTPSSSAADAAAGWDRRGVPWSAPPALPPARRTPAPDSLP